MYAWHVRGHMERESQPAWRRARLAGQRGGHEGHQVIKFSPQGDEGRQFVVVQIGEGGVHPGSLAALALPAEGSDAK